MFQIILITGSCFKNSELEKQSESTVIKVSRALMSLYRNIIDSGVTNTLKYFGTADLGTGFDIKAIVENHRVFPES